MWMIVVLSLFMALSYYSLETYIRWQERPVILGFDQQQTSVFEIPFPSVSYCPVAKFDREAIDFENAYKNYQENVDGNESVAILEAASIICQNKEFDLSHKKPHKALNMSAILRRNKMKFPASYTWNKNQDHRVMHTLTDEGICETFNSISANLIFRNDTVDKRFIKEYHWGTSGLGVPPDPVYWSMEDGYLPNVNNYPYRAFDGESNGLKAEPGTDQNKLKDIQTFCNKNSKNFKLIFNHPAEVPRVANNDFLVSFNKSIVVLVIPKITKTSDDLRSYDAAV
jgi:amiloride-sensitive sodium channel